MDYYIMKLYESKKDKQGLKLGLNRFSKMTKIAVIILLILLFLLTISEIVLLFVFPKQLWVLLFMIPCIFITITLCILDNMNEKNGIENYIEEHNKKIDILYEILLMDFKINSKEKLEMLIQKYQKHIDKRDKEEKARNRAIMTLFSGFWGILSISISKLDIIGIDFISWLYIAILLLIPLGVISLFIYSAKYFDSLKHKYENMVNDLEDVKISKY